MKDTRSPRILISRLGHIGDCILTIPLLNALRAHFPNAFVAWVIESPSDQLLRRHEALDELIVLRRGWLKSPQQVWALRRQLRALQLDIAIDPQSLTKSAVAAWLSGAPRRIGFSRGLARELAPLLNRQQVSPRSQHLVDRTLELLRPLGICSTKVEFRIREDAVAQATIDQFLSSAHLRCGFAVLNPGAGWPSRRWPPARYAVVARYLGERYALASIITWAGQQEHAWAEAIVAQSGGHARLAPSTTLAELAALLRSAWLFVGSDSGPLHLACAVGAKCIGLHGTTRPGHSGVYGPGHTSIQAYYQGGTSRQRRRAANEAMCAIQPATVCQACDELLAGRVAGSASSAA